MKLHETDLSLLPESVCADIADTSDGNRSYPLRFDVELCAAKEQNRDGFEPWLAEEKEEGRIKFSKVESKDNVNQTKYYGGES